MRQEVLIEYPPIYDDIVVAFPAATKPGVIFSFGDKIYNPHGVRIPGEIMEHEAVHGGRQLDMGVAKWWAQYVTDIDFVVREEVYAHHAEYRGAVKRHGHRAKDLRRIAEKLSGPLYGKSLSYEQAEHAILTGELT